MEKASFKKLGVDLFEGLSQSGLRFVLAPKPDQHTKVFGLMVNRGGLADLAAIGGTRIPAGTAHFLEHRMFQTPQGDGMKALMAMGADANAFTDKSCTFYYFSTVGDWEKPLAFLLDMVSRFSMSEERVEKEKPIIVGELQGLVGNPAYLFDKTVLHSLYFDAPIKDEPIGTPETINQIHLSTLRKFFLAFYGVANLTLFASGGFDPNRVSALLDRFRPANAFRPLAVTKAVLKPEDYSRVRTPMAHAVSPDGQTFLGVGIKFPARKTLFEKYGDTLFALYELLPALVTSGVLVPIDSLRKDGLAIFEAYTGFEQAGEDAFLSVLYETNAPARLKARLEAHLAQPEQALSPLGGDLKAIKLATLGDDLAAAGTPAELVELLVSSYQNHFAWPALAESAAGLPTRTVMKFLKDLGHWPRAYVQLDGKGTDR